MRRAQINRKTAETDIKVDVNLDGQGHYSINTGVGFLDHMLQQLSRHSLIDIHMVAVGDTHIDDHHVTEDSALVLGSAVSHALADRRGIVRYGSALIPMDETLVRVALDCSNRPYLSWNVQLTQDKVGSFDTELVKEWFKGFAQTAGLTLHVEVIYGLNNHHMIEASYKALARALRQAIEVDARKNNEIPSTKGILKSGV